MNVSMIVLNTFTHDARVMKEAKTLHTHGHRVTVNALWAAGLPTQETVEGIHVQRIRLRSREGIHIPFAAWVELVPKFVLTVRTQQPDVCHAHDLNALIPAYFAARLTSARLIYDSHELETGRTPSHRSSSRWGKRARQVEGLLIHRANAVITVSPPIASELARLYGIPRPAVIRNCPESVDLPQRGTLRQELELPDKSQIVLYQGRFTKGRGLEPLLRAAAQVPDATLVMLGDGPLCLRLQALAAELGTEERVYLPGKVSLHDLLRYTRDADIGICLTENTCLNHYYSLPNKLFEYLMMGVPVLASDLPEISRVVLDAGAGAVVDPADVEAIAATLRRLLSDRPALARMGHCARQAAVQRYNWDQEAKGLLELYRRWTRSL